jgi:hypothetical protein
LTRRPACRGGLADQDLGCAAESDGIRSITQPIPQPASRQMPRKATITR